MDKKIVLVLKEWAKQKKVLVRIFAILLIFLGILIGMEIHDIAWLGFLSFSIWILGLISFFILQFIHLIRYFRKKISYNQWNNLKLLPSVMLPTVFFLSMFFGSVFYDEITHHHPENIRFALWVCIIGLLFATGVSFISQLMFHPDDKTNDKQ